MANLTSKDLSQGLIVVAHPDDEALWFSSLLSSVPEVISCFKDVRSRPDCSEGRSRLLESGRLGSHRSLGLVEAEVFNAADWPNPEVRPYGLGVRRNSETMPGFSAQIYRQNFDELLAALRPLLHASNHVFTHNPWGEYGHEEHVQVFRALNQLREEIGFSLYVSGYISNRSLGLFGSCAHRLGSVAYTGETDIKLAESLRDAYMDFGCWTWAKDYKWPVFESFYRWVGADAPGDSRPVCSSLNFILLSWAPKKAHVFLKIFHAVRKAMTRSISS